jgi:hypothetical protein
MAGVGTLISAAEYNNIQAKISVVLGSGSGQTGYGQSLQSGQVVPGDKIRVGQWLNLRTDLLKARQHQTGADESGNLTIPTTSITVSEALRVQYSGFADIVTTDKFMIDGSQATLEPLITGSIGTWNGVRTNVVTITFSSADRARNFFNAGGDLRVTSSRSGGGGGSKNDTWTTMLDQSGSVIINYTTTISTGSSPGTVYNIGFYGLTTSNQTIYWKPAPAGNYAANDYYVYARKSSDGTQVIITSEFRDDDTGSGSSVYPSTPVDEDVTGTTSNTIQIFRPTGSNVSVAAPTATKSGF